MKLSLIIAPLIFAAVLVSSCTRTSSPDDAETAASPGVGERPNIVLVLFEDMSPRVGAYGDPLAHTPHFDRIAAEGVLYTNVFTTSGVCAPSRAALITGRYQQTIGAQHMRTTSAAGLPPGGPQNYLAVPPPGVVAFPELLRAEGYYASNDSKTDYQFGEPFTIWDTSGDGADWSGREPGQPFFHMQTLLTTHESAIWPVDMEARTPIEAFVVNRNAEIFADRPARTNPAKVAVPPYLPDTPEVRRDIATHYDNIAFTDAILGALYDRLDREGLLKNTILIVSTDHGDGLPRMKRSLYDSGLHVPMVIRYPNGWGAGAVNDELVSFVDLAPTLLSWAAADKPDWLHGLDFVGDDRDPPREYVFAAQDRMDSEPNLRRAIRDDRFKLIVNDLDGDPYFEPLPFRDAQPAMKALWAALEAGTLPAPAAALFEPLPAYQLYDTVNDPHEIDNLADKEAYADELSRLKMELSRWRDRVGDMSLTPEADMIMEMWPGGEQPATQAPVATVTVDNGFQRITLSSPTPGASIGYRLREDDGSEHWMLYTAPLTLQPDAVIEAKAVRYGFAESDVVQVDARD